MDGMEKLEMAASAIFFLAFLSFLGAWDAQGEAGEKYRDTVRNFGWLLISPLPFLAGKLIGFGAWMASPISGRAGKYREMRAYKGDHHEGVAPLKWQRA